MSFFDDIAAEVPPETKAFFDRIRAKVAAHGSNDPDSPPGDVIEMVRSFARPKSEGGELDAPAVAPEASSALEAKVEDFREVHRAKLRNARDGETQTLERRVVDFPLSKIRTDLIPNARSQTDVRKYESLRASMAKDGQLQEVLGIERRDGNADQIIGFTRTRAARDLGWKTIRMLLLPVGTTVEHALWLNLSENVHRDDISTFDLAERVAYMIATFDVTQAECARRLGFAESWVSRLVRALDLPPEIVRDWRAGLVKTEALEQMLRLSREDASAYWARNRGLGHGALRALAPRSKRKYLKRGEGRRPASTLLSRAHVAIRRCSDYDDRAKELALAAIDFALGVETTILDVYDPRKTLRGMRARKDDWEEEDRELPLPTHDQGEFAMGGPSRE